MALDKQRILSELGSVVNQLQSADCGCMGNIFSNSNQGGCGMNNGMPNYGGYGGGHHGHHHTCHGHGAPCAGEPCPMNNNMNAPCMGFCNPPKLYAETYGYLNNNLMQPIVKEVYDDLKSINPNNSVMNSPMAGQMGLSAQGNKVPGMPPNMGNEMGQMTNPLSGNTMGNVPGAGNPNMGNAEMNMQMGTEGQQGMQQNMMGMGPQIMKMMNSDGSAKRMGMPNRGQPMGSEIAPQGQSNMTGNAGNPGYYNPGTKPDGVNQGLSYPATPGMDTFNMGQTNQMHNMTPAQYNMTQPNMYSDGNGNAANTENIPYNGNHNTAQLGSAYNNEGQQQMIPNRQNNSQGRYGQHAAGISKFNEMFPGVMKGLGGDLAFDPMALAIQMNPANLKQAAIQSMQDMMMKNKTGLNQVLDATGNAGNNQAGQNQPNQSQQSNQLQQPNQLQHPNQLQQNASGYITTPTSQTATNLGTANAGGLPTQQYQVPQQQQQVYSAVTGPATLGQGAPQQQYQQPQEMIDPNKQGQHLPTVYEGSRDPNAYNNIQTPDSGTQQPQQIIKEPIHPADTTNKQYNTLGQPVEMLPASVYHTTTPNLPQTLSPQPTSGNMYSNVKSTISKTSLMENKPIGKVPSRSQLQHIYNQYKGSQSFTQQNITPHERFSHSEGNLNVQSNPPRTAPVEKVAGDHIHTNQVPTKFDNALGKGGDFQNNAVVGRMGDVPANYKPPDVAAEGQSARTAGYLRNGLQDMKFTSYPMSTAWTFHGNNQAPFSTGYQYRSRN